LKVHIPDDRFATLRTHPPNGATSVGISPVLMPTMPLSSPSVQNLVGAPPGDGG
jgi:hypothetical protein